MQAQRISRSAAALRRLEAELKISSDGEIRCAAAIGSSGRPAYPARAEQREYLVNIPPRARPLRSYVPPRACAADAALQELQPLPPTANPQPSAATKAGKGAVAATDRVVAGEQGFDPVQVAGEKRRLGRAAQTQSSNA